MLFLSMLQIGCDEYLICNDIGNASHSSLEVAFANVFVITDIIILGEAYQFGRSLLFPLGYPHFITSEQRLAHKHQIMGCKEHLLMCRVAAALKKNSN